MVSSYGHIFQEKLTYMNWYNVYCIVVKCTGMVKNAQFLLKLVSILSHIQIKIHIHYTAKLLNTISMFFS